MSREEIAIWALALVTVLRDKGYSPADICQFFGTGFGGAVMELPPEQRLVHMRAHLDALEKLGIWVVGNRIVIGDPEITGRRRGRSKAKSGSAPERNSDKNSDREL